jgi:tRNA(fMet)-specific endonuclease VapC
VILLDTDVFTIVQHGVGEAYGRLASRMAGVHPEPVCVTLVSFEEQVRGWLAYLSAARTSMKRIQGYSRLATMLRHYCANAVVEFDARADAEFERLTKAKVRIGTLDLRIAAIALVHNALLVSRNLRDFRKVPGLRVEDWTV